MSHPPQSLNSRSQACPVFQPGLYIGREGMVRNMLRRLERGQSLSIVGGPKLGKTSLLLHLSWQLNRPNPSRPSNEPIAEYFDVAVETDGERLRSRSPKAGAIVLLDNCDCLIDVNSALLSALNLSQDQTIVFAGSRMWKDFVEGGGMGFTVKPIPLAVFLEKEAKQILSPNLSQEQQACVLTHGGTHPFLLKILQSEIISGTSGKSPQQVGPQVSAFLGEFFQSCVDQLRDSTEHRVLTVLIDKAKPMNPKDVARAVGLTNIKPIADTLCYLGLISRWIRDEEATLFANSRLFNDWYIQSFHRPG